MDYSMENKKRQHEDEPIYSKRLKTGDNYSPSIPIIYQKVGLVAYSYLTDEYILVNDQLFLNIHDPHLDHIIIDTQFQDQFSGRGQVRTISSFELVGTSTINISIIDGPDGDYDCDFIIHHIKKYLITRAPVTGFKLNIVCQQGTLVCEIVYVNPYTSYNVCNNDTVIDIDKIKDGINVFTVKKIPYTQLSFKILLFENYDVRNNNKNNFYLKNLPLHQTIEHGQVIAHIEDTYQVALAVSISNRDPYNGPVKIKYIINDIHDRHIYLINGPIPVVIFMRETIVPEKVFVMVEVIDIDTPVQIDRSTIGNLLIKDKYVICHHYVVDLPAIGKKIKFFIKNYMFDNQLYNDIYVFLKVTKETKVILVASDSRIKFIDKIADWSLQSTISNLGPLYAGDIKGLFENMNNEENVFVLVTKVINDNLAKIIREIRYKLRIPTCNYKYISTHAHIHDKEGLLIDNMMYDINKNIDKLIDITNDNNHKGILIIPHFICNHISDLNGIVIKRIRSILHRTINNKIVVIFIEKTKNITIWNFINSDENVTLKKLQF